MRNRLKACDGMGRKGELSLPDFECLRLVAQRAEKHQNVSGSDVLYAICDLQGYSNERARTLSNASQVALLFRFHIRKHENGAGR